MHGARRQGRPGLYQPNALSAEELAQGKVLACCATALDDAEIEYDATNFVKTMQEYTARVVKLEKLSYDVMRVLLKLPEGQIAFKASQYINIILEDGQRRAFSFANPPHEPEFVELQIRLVAGAASRPMCSEAMNEGDEIRFEGPLGDFSLRESERPIVFVAGATGFAPVKSMVEDAFKRGIKRQIHLYWGVKRLKDLYLPTCRSSGRRNMPTSTSFRYSRKPRRRTGGPAARVWCTEAILADFPELKGHEIYACGSVRMVEAIFRRSKQHGAEDGQCFSDAFTVSARSMAFQPQQK